MLSDKMLKLSCILYIAEIFDFRLLHVGVSASNSSV